MGKGSEQAASRQGGAEGGDAPGRGRGVALFVILAAFWFLLSGRVGVQYAIFMLASVGLVLALNPERPFEDRTHTEATRTDHVSLRGRLRAGGYLLRYVAWLVWNVIKANVDVAYRILHPRLPIQPSLFLFRTRIRHEVGQVLVANSITLTPGTVTIDLADGAYLVHALHPSTAGPVISGELQNAVAPVFGEPPDPAPRIHWLPGASGAAR